MTTPDPGNLQPGETVYTPSHSVELMIDGLRMGAATTPGATVTAAPAPPATPDPMVLKLQADINADGYTPALAVDGWYGPATDVAVRSYLPVPPPPPPPPPPVLGGWGVNQLGWKACGFNNLQAFEDALGSKFAWVRQFHTMAADDRSAKAEEKLVAQRGGGVCSSLKITTTNYAGVLHGDADSQIKRWLDYSLPLGRYDLCLNHEHNMPTGSMKDGTPRQFADVQAYGMDLLHKHPDYDPKQHRLGTIWVPGTFDATQWPLTADVVDFVGADPYRWGVGRSSPTNWEPLVSHATKVINWAAALGRPLVFPEFGIGVQPGHGADRAASFKEFVTYAEANSEYFCYYHGASPSDEMELRQEPETWQTYQALAHALGE